MVWLASGECIRHVSYVFALGTFGSSAVFFLFLQLFDVCVIGSVVLDLTCASVFKNFASARGVKEVFGTHEKLKCRAYNILLASESHAWVSTPSSSWQQGRARPEGQTCRLQSRGDDHHDFEDLRHVPQKKGQPVWLRPGPLQQPRGALARHAGRTPEEPLEACRAQLRPRHECQRLDQAHPR